MDRSSGARWGVVLQEPWPAKMSQYAAPASRVARDAPGHAWGMRRPLEFSPSPTSVAGRAGAALRCAAHGARSDEAYGRGARKHAVIAALSINAILRAFMRCHLCCICACHILLCCVHNRSVWGEGGPVAVNSSCKRSPVWRSTSFHSCSHRRHRPFATSAASFWSCSVA